MPTGSMYRVRMVLSNVAAGPIYLTGYFDSAGGGAGSAASAWQRAFYASAAELRIGAICTTDPQVDLVDPVTGSIISTVTVSVPTLTGTAAYDLSAVGVQGAVNWRTGTYVAGREIRGRTFQPLVGVNDLTAAGVFQSAYVTGKNTKAAQLIADPASTFVIWSRAHGRWEAVVSGTTNTLPSYLHSRRT